MVRVVCHPVESESILEFKPDRTTECTTFFSLEETSHITQTVSDCRCRNQHSLLDKLFTTQKVSKSRQGQHRNSGVLYQRRLATIGIIRWKAIIIVFVFFTFVHCRGNLYNHAATRGQDWCNRFGIRMLETVLAMEFPVWFVDVGRSGTTSDPTV